MQISLYRTSESDDDDEVPVSMTDDGHFLSKADRGRTFLCLINEFMPSRYA